jgi:hypothetical protein
MQEAQVIEGYAIGGAIGALFYIEPIETHDLDIFAALPESESGLVTLEPIYQYLDQRGYHPEGEHVVIDGVPVQVLVPSTPLQAEALESAGPRSYGAESVRVMSAEHLVAMMVELNRPKDRIRISIFLEQADVDAEKLAAILARHGLTQKWNKILTELGLEHP